MTFVSNDAGKIKLQIHWKGELSGFGVGSLNIENGECSKCDDVPGHTREEDKEFIYEIDTDDLDKHVIVKWQHEYCGTGSLTIPKPRP